jgi:hypothetical protein
MNKPSLPDERMKGSDRNEESAKKYLNQKQSFPLLMIKLGG